MPSVTSKYQKFIEWNLILFSLLLFLSLGIDKTPLFQTRITYLGFIFLISIPVILKERNLLAQSKPLILFLFILLFAGVRYGFSTLRWFHLEGYQSVYLESLVIWVSYFCVFLLFFIYGTNQIFTKKFLWISAFAIVFLALNAFPNVLTSNLVEASNYKLPGGEVSYFYSGFNFLGPVAKAVFAPYCQINYIGDIYAVGVFSALGIFLYAFTARFGPEIKVKYRISFYEIGLPIAIIFVSLMGVFIYNARGTMLAFSGALLVFILICILKFPNRRNFMVVFGLLILSGAFLVFNGTLKEAWEELATVQEEIQSLKVSDAEGMSVSANKEGAKRALGMIKERPIWGFGYGGYRVHAKAYATEGTQDYWLQDQFASNHYLQVFAEEGVGFIFYAVFLIFYLFAILKELMREVSRSVFYYANALYCIALLFLAHAMINHLLQRANMSFLLYAVMGLCAGILTSGRKREGITHE